MWKILFDREQEEGEINNKPKMRRIKMCGGQNSWRHSKM